MHLHPRGDQEKYQRQLERELRQAREHDFEQDALAPLPLPGHLDLNLSSSRGSSFTVKLEPAAPEQDLLVQPKQEPLVEPKQEPLVEPKPGPSSRRRKSLPERLGCQPGWFDPESSSEDETPAKKPRQVWVCDLCDSVFSYPSKLKRHVLNAHTGNKVGCPRPGCRSRILPESLQRHWRDAHSPAGLVSVPATFSLCGACGTFAKDDCGCTGNSFLEVEELVSLLAANLEVPHAW